MIEIKRDIQMDEHGDLVIRGYDRAGYETVDLALVDRQLSVAQSIAIRLKTQLEEFALHPQIGNQLIQILGERNTRETAEIGRRLLIETITRDNYIVESDLTVEAIPMDEITLLYTVNAKVGPFNYVSMILELDLVNGIRRVIES